MNKKEDKKKRILEAAAVMFARKGFSGTVMEDISTAAKMGKGTLYGYFNSKDDLFFSLFEFAVEDWINALDAMIEAAEGGVTEQMLSVNKSVLSIWYDMKDLFSLTMEFWAASSAAPMKDNFKGAFKRLYAELRKRISAMITDGVAAGEFKDGLDADAIAASIAGFWDSMYLQAWFDEKFDPVQTGCAFFSVIMDGMKKND